MSYNFCGDLRFDFVVNNCLIYQLGRCSFFSFLFGLSKCHFVLDFEVLLKKRMFWAYIVYVFFGEKGFYFYFFSCELVIINEKGAFFEMGFGHHHVNVV